MNNFSSKNLKKTLFASGLILALIGGFAGQVFFSQMALAESPQFNIFTPYVHTQTYNRDYFLLDVKNETKGSDWNFPINADPNDVLVFYFYYHNGIVGTLANNTTLKINLPGGQNTQHAVIGSLWADNATNASQSNPLTQSVQINLSSAQSLQYVSGSAKWFPNQTDWRTDASTPFPSGQTDSQLFGSGINLGSIEGCWEFSGAIVFKAKVGASQPVLTSDLSINKTVRNETAGQTSYYENTNANSSDRLIFQIQIQNTGTAVLNNVMVRDVLPARLIYESNSTRSDNNFIADGITSGGINLGSLAVGQGRTVTFATRVEPLVYTSSGSYYDQQNLINYAYARADQVSERSNTATVYLSQGNTGYLTLAKYVRNISAGQIGLLTSTNANNGDQILFTIQISVPGSNQQVNNVRIWDNLPAGLSYVSGSAKLDNNYISDGLLSGGVNIGTITNNQTRNITFQASVNSGINNQTLINYAYASGDNISQQTAFAQVVIGQTQQNISATVTKKVVNLTFPNGNDSDNTAYVGQTLQYTITMTNNGPGILNNISVIDVLPPYVTFQAADNGGYYNSSTNQVTWTNGSLANGTSLSFTYRTTVQAVPYNNYVIQNTASGDADNISQINSNETRTTVITNKGVTVVTGSNNMARNIALSVIISLWSMFLLYLALEYTEFWRRLKLRLAILKIKVASR